MITKIIRFLVFSILIGPYQLFSQDITFEKIFGYPNLSDMAYSVYQTIDNGYLICGSGGSFNNHGIYLIRTDMYGNQLWDQTYCTTTGMEWGYCLEKTYDNCYVILGTCSNETILIKINSNGSTLWEKRFEKGGKFVKQTMDKGFIIAGTAENNGSDDVLLIKTDSTGNLQWCKKIGSSTDEGASCVQQTIDGGFIICASIVINGIQNDIFIIKTDGNGDLIWNKSYGGEITDVGHFIEKTIDNGFIICGLTSNYGANGNDVYLLKIDANGNKIWGKPIDNDIHDNAYCIQQTKDNGFIICGESGDFHQNRHLFLLKTDNLGNLIWKKLFGSGSLVCGFDIKQTNDQGYIICGSSDADYYVLKTDKNGDVNLFIPEYKNKYFSTFINPNPFSNSTNITYELSNTSSVTISIYNSQGQQVDKIINKKQLKGEHTIVWDARNLPAGIYMLRIQAGNQAGFGKMILFCKSFQ